MIPTSESIAKLRGQIAKTSATFGAVAAQFAPIASDSKTTSSSIADRSHATELAVLLRAYVRFNPAQKSYKIDTNFLEPLQVCSMYLLPELIQWPVATFDVLAGMLDGLSALLGVVEPGSDRSRVLSHWNEAISVITDQLPEVAAPVVEQKKTASFAMAAATTMHSTPAVVAVAPVAKAVVSVAAALPTTPPKPVATKDMTSVFRARFETVADDDDE